MEIHNEVLTELVEELVENLIRIGREDDWWNFKEFHNEDRTALIHDVIYLANNRFHLMLHEFEGILFSDPEAFALIAETNECNTRCN